jgi:hypothetical protein
VENPDASGNGATFEWEISDALRSDFKACCARQGSYYEETFGYPWCDTSDGDATRERVRHLSDHAGKTKGEAVFNIGELNQSGGIFDALEHAIQIPVTLIFMVAGLSLGWIILLREFSKPIVYATEFCKVLALFYLASQTTGDMMAASVFVIAAVLYLCFIMYIRKRLDFCSKIISHACLALKQNTSMFYGLIAIKGVYVLFAFLFIQAFAKSVQIYEVGEATYRTGGEWDPESYEMVYSDEDEYITHCGLQEKSGVGPQRFLLGVIFMWIVTWFTQARLTIIAITVGGWHFHPEEKMATGDAVKVALTKSAGAISFSSLVLTILTEIKKRLTIKWYKAAGWHAVTGCMMLPFHCAACALLWCIERCLKMLTKFTLIIHSFTGQSFVSSAKLTKSVMSRHFVGAVITDAVSSNVLALGAYVFSMCVSMAAWGWIDYVYDFHTLNPAGDDALGFMFFFWLVFMSIGVYNPVLCVAIVIFIDMLLASYSSGQENWVSPMTAVFVGSICRLLFNYMAGIILDAIDVCFVCWAVDKDNDLDLSNEFSSIVMAMPGVKKSENIAPSSAGIQMQQMPAAAGGYAPMPAQPMTMLMVDPQTGQQVQVMVGTPM